MHQQFRFHLKPDTILFAAGFLVENQHALYDFEAVKLMMEFNFMGETYCECGK